MYLGEETYKKAAEQEVYAEIPTLKGFYVKRDVLSKDSKYPILDSQRKETGIYLETKVYKDIFSQKKLVEIPNLKGFYVQVGEQPSEKINTLEKKVEPSRIIEEDITDQVKEYSKTRNKNFSDTPFFSMKREETQNQIKFSSENQTKLIDQEEAQNPVKINYDVKLPEKPVKKTVKFKEDLPEPVIIKSESASNNFYPIFDEKRKKIGLYVEDGLYKKLSKEKKKEEIVKIPGLEGLYIKAGQERATAFFSHIISGGNYMRVYSKGGILEEIYVSEPKMRNVCYKKEVEKEQPYDGRLEKIPGTSLELRCALFNAPDKWKDSGGGGDGGSSGGGASGGGGQGGGGGNSGGAR